MNLNQTIAAILTFLFALISGEDTYIEGLIGQPQNINPLFAHENPVDQDLVALIFEGLTRFDENGSIVPGLAESWEISEDKKTYTFKLNPHTHFHDGKLAAVKDVVYTAQKNPQFQGLIFEEVNSQTIQIKLETPFVPLLQLLTCGILPQHLEGRAQPLLPIGAGPYRIKEIEQGTRKVESITLEKFRNDRPGPTKIKLKFYEDGESLLTAAKLGEIQAFESVREAPSNFSTQKVPLGGRYFSLIFNTQKEGLLQNTEFRKTLAQLTNRERIVNEALKNAGRPLYGPLQTTWAGTELNPTYKPEPAKTYEGSVKIVFPDSETHQQTLNIIEKDWERTGITITIEAVTPAHIKDKILPSKDFEIALIGQEVGRDPDRYSLWHSTQIENGANFPGYKNMRVDRALEKGRQEHNPDKRRSHYQNFQEIFIEDLPAIFLYQPTYNYHIRKTKNRGLNLEGIFVPRERWQRILSTFPNPADS